MWNGPACRAAICLFYIRPTNIFEQLACVRHNALIYRQILNGQKHGRIVPGLMDLRKSDIQQSGSVSDWLRDHRQVTQPL